VKSAEEAQRIKLVEKQSMQRLDLVWTRDAKRFVDDTELLKQLMPPDTVEEFLLQGYNGVSFPFWMMDITTYLHRLNKVVLKDLPSCNKLATTTWSVTKPRAARDPRIGWHYED